MDKNSENKNVDPNLKKCSLCSNCIRENSKDFRVKYAELLCGIAAGAGIGFAMTVCWFLL